MTKVGGNKSNCMDSNFISKTLTPFEKLDSRLMYCPEELNSGQYSDLLQYWDSIVCNKMNSELVSKYNHLLQLNDNKKLSMLKYPKIQDIIMEPGWQIVFKEIFTNQYDRDLRCSLNMNVAWSKLLIPFVKVFRNHISQSLNRHTENDDFEFIKDQLSNQLLLKLSDISKCVFQKEFDKYKAKHGFKNSFIKYTDEVIYTEYSLFVTKYPMLFRILCQETYDLIIHIEEFLTRLRLDSKSIKQKFKILTLTIKELDLTLSDKHNGKSVIIVSLSNDMKLVYKPRSVKCCKLYNDVIEITNRWLNESLKRVKCICRKNYGWMEYIKNSSCGNESEVEKYYERAGILLGIVYFTNGTDFHFENIIASKSSPVIIDHETFLQPKIRSRYSNAFTQYDGIENSVYLTHLLPINLSKFGISKFMSGFSEKWVSDEFGIQKNVININSDNSKIGFENFKLHRNSKNKPHLNGEAKYLKDYLKYLVKGFEKFYLYILENKTKVVSEFQNILSKHKSTEFRFIWRPTYLYYKILKILNKPEFLVDSNKYGIKLESFVRPYLKHKNYGELIGLYKNERSQLLKGYIPIFNVKANGEYMYYNNYSCRMFELSPINNFISRLKNSSSTDKNNQINSIFEKLNK